MQKKSQSEKFQSQNQHDVHFQKIINNSQFI